MPRREFATQKKLQDYAERIGDTYLLARADEVIE
jgi:hypothetical protein